jgi:protocatechuate 3,4-dioxygenase alpha subunit
MSKRANVLPETASQTAGPYVHIGLLPSAAGFRGFETELGHDIAGPEAAGDRIRIEGIILDGDGATWAIPACGDEVRAGPASAAS